jgi:hypothetical protein
VVRETARLAVATEATLLEGLPKKDRPALAKLLAKLAANLEQNQDSPPAHNPPSPSVPQTLRNAEQADRCGNSRLPDRSWSPIRQSGAGRRL